MDSALRTGWVSLMLFTTLLIRAQPAIQWQQAYGGTNADWIYSIEQTSDGGYIMAGYTYSNDGDVSGFHSGEWDATDAWVVKFSETGNIQWQRALGGSGSESASTVQQTMDGGYIVAGSTTSPNDGDVSGNHGLSDAWAVKLDGSGTIQWQSALGGTGEESASTIHQTTDGGYIMTGYASSSSDGDLSGNDIGEGIWMVKLNGSGSIQWQQVLSGTTNDAITALQQTSDGGYITAGWDGLISTGLDDIVNALIIKFDGAGAIQWQQIIGGTAFDEATDIEQTNDGGYIMSGITCSNDVNVSGHHEGGYWNGSGEFVYNPDGWVVKLDGTGAIQWQKCLGGSDSDDAMAIQQTTGAGYIIAGGTESNDGDVSGNHGGYDGWVVHLDDSGTIQWQETIGGEYSEWLHDIRQTVDGGYIMVGHSIDAPGEHGGPDGWVVKLGPDWNGINELSEPNLALRPNPTTGLLYLFWNQAQGDATISIFDATGRVMDLVHEAGTHCIMDLGSYKSGIYSVKAVFSDDTQITKRIVKE